MCLQARLQVGVPGVLASCGSAYALASSRSEASMTPARFLWERS